MDTKLPPIARLGKPAVAHVIFEIEMFIVNPVREIELQGDVHEPALEQGAHVQAALDVRQNILETNNVAVRYSRLVEDRYGGEVSQVIRRFQIKELGVLRAELVHMNDPYWPCEALLTTRGGSWSSALRYMLRTSAT